MVGASSWYEIYQKQNSDSLAGRRAKSESSMYARVATSSRPYIPPDPVWTMVKQSHSVL